MIPNGVGFLGGGRVARVLLAGWERAEVMPPDVVVHDPDAAAVGRLTARFPSVRVSPDGPAGLTGCGDCSSPYTRPS